MAGPRDPYGFLNKTKQKRAAAYLRCASDERADETLGGFQSSEGVGCGQIASTLTECDHRARRGSWEENTSYSELCGSKVRWKRVAFV